MYTLLLDIYKMAKLKFVLFEKLSLPNLYLIK